MQQLKISVVTVCYNAAAAIEETILSVIGQSYDNIEYIIIDGGSTDGTVDIIKKYADGGCEAGKHNQLVKKWISEPDKGIYDAMNKGIALATGDYINFMNTGDSFCHKDVIKELVEKSVFRGEIIFGDAIFTYPNGKLHVKPRELVCMSYRDPILHQSSFTPTALLKETPFDINFKIAGDYKFFYTQYFNNIKFKYVDYTISNFDANDGISSNAISLRIEENAKISGCKKGLKYKLKKYCAITKFKCRIILHRIAPDFANKLRFKLLCKDSRINPIND